MYSNWRVFFIRRNNYENYSRTIWKAIRLVWYIYISLRFVIEKEAVNYKKRNCSKPIAFGKRERKAEVVSELFKICNVFKNFSSYLFPSLGLKTKQEL
jgi:hypothetical protein